MKIKQIKPQEPFDLNGTIYEYTIAPDGKLLLKQLKKASKRIKTDFMPPTLADVKEWFSEQGYSEEGAIRAYKHYTDHDANWHDSHGKKVKNWKQKMTNNWLKPEYKLNNNFPGSGGMVM